MVVLKGNVGLIKDLFTELLNSSMLIYLSSAIKNN